MFILTIFAILLLFIPTIYQYRIGNKSLNKSVEINFGTVCLISFILQFIITILSFMLTAYSITSNGNKCATGAVAIFVFSFLITIFMVIVIIFQFFNRNKYN